MFVIVCAWNGRCCFWLLNNYYLILIVLWLCETFLGIR
uniref:Uncharacterized protein n=1 Tax=Arundo donax TaxID=35708 RepID=A0A0A9B9L3_ARUDO